MSINVIAQKYIQDIQIKCERIKPLVVIHSLTFNHEPYLRKALDGFVMQQTKFPFVAVVHDDASTDKTAQILREYAERFPEIILPIFEEENQWSKKGALDEIKKAYIEATGAKYVATCEGDDCWIDPYKLQKQVEILEKDSSVSLIHTGFNVINNDNLELKSPKYESFNKIGRSGFVLEELLRRNYILTCTVMVRKDIFNSYFYINSPSKMDYLTFLTAAIEGNIYYLPDKTSQYRVSEQGQMLSNANGVAIKFSMIYRYFLDQYLKNKISFKGFKNNFKVKQVIVANTLKGVGKPKDVSGKYYLFKLYPKLIFYLPTTILSAVLKRLKKIF